MKRSKKKTTRDSVLDRQFTLFDSFFDALTIGHSQFGFTDEETDLALNELRKAKERYSKAVRETNQEREAQAERERIEKEQQEKEHIRQVTTMEIPMDWDNSFCEDERAANIHAESIADGLIISLTTLGMVDIEYISAITGEDIVTVISTLKGAIYQNPEKWDECFYKGWETEEEYLSGNLHRKWKAAKEANKKYRGYFKDNVKAIEAALPAPIHHEDIYITLGSPWVPTDIIDDFIEHLFGEVPGLKYMHPAENRKRYAESLKVKHDEMTGSWEVPVKTRYNHSIGVDVDYGTAKINALHILEKTLNMKTVAVYDVVTCLTTSSGKRKELNKSETILAIEKQTKMIEAFKDWVWQDERRKERLEIIYENQYSCVRKRRFNGSFLSFPEMASDVELYPYQKNAVARILFAPNTLLAHDVGAGKTYTMIAAAMELKRMGLSRKNLFVVPNNLVGQWQTIYKKLYPTANILCVEPKQYTPSKRSGILKNIRDKEYDGIIMAYSCFEQIPISRDFMIKEYEALKDEIDERLSKESRATSKLKKKKETISKLLSELVVKAVALNDDVFFDELGISRLFVDEAHNYKNVPLETKIDKVLGISAAGSAKCQDMLDKTRVVQKQNNGGGIVFATATPITNSITDAYIMQKYLQSGELAMMDLQSFDSWVGMFAERVSEFEVDVDTSGYRLATRFSKFHNLPELTSLLASVADFHQIDASAGIPELDGYDDELIGQTDDLYNFLGQISMRAEDVRRGYVSRNTDNMLKITSDGRKAALDMRLVQPMLPFTYQSKVSRCADRVFDIWTVTASQRSTQLVFCDSSTPKPGFNMYDELRRILVAKGIPNDEIAFVHDAETEKQRVKLFSAMQKGGIRILIGSTFKLGLGVNVQDKLIAVHHLDVPWRPADMTQREGRILRQGNTNSKVQIFRYITEGSFDAYSWQLLETKQRFICDLLSGSLVERSGSDIENTVLNYAEIKALAVGNPAVKKRIETANELAKFVSLQKRAIQTKVQLEEELRDTPLKIKEQELRISNCKLDLTLYEQSFKELDKVKREKFREGLYTLVNGNVLKPKERKAFTYQGFSVLLPANMVKEKPFVYIQGNGRYYVELSGSKTGGLIRVDNFLNGLEDHLTKLKNNLEHIHERKKAIEMLLAESEDYSEQIEQLKRELQILDNQLGVKQ